MEGSKSAEFFNFTGLIFVLASLSYNGTFSNWLARVLPVQLIAILVTLSSKDQITFTSINVFVDRYSLIVSGLIIGSAAAYLTSSRFVFMKNYLLEREEKFNLAKQISHDLRSPLAFIRNVLSEGDFDSLKRKQIIEMSLLRIESIAVQLFHKSLQGKKFDLYELFSLIKFEKLSLYSNHKDVSLAFHIDEKLRKHFPSKDLSSLITATSNIIDNAVEAVGFNGVVSINLELSSNNLSITVKDTGKGVPESIVAKIYDRDFTFQKKTGSGLGLYQAKQAVEELFGTLQLIENGINGATFRIYIPDIYDSSEEKSEEIAASLLSLEDESLTVKTDAEKVLPTGVILIDDDKFIRLNWSMHFNAAGIFFKSYSSISAFIEDASNISKDFYIYIDSSLGDNIIGEIESEKIFNLGYSNLFISTGHDPESIVKPTWIKKVFTKSPVGIYSFQEND